MQGALQQPVCFLILGIANRQGGQPLNRSTEQLLLDFEAGQGARGLGIAGPFTEPVGGQVTGVIGPIGNVSRLKQPEESLSVHHGVTAVAAC